MPVKIFHFFIILIVAYNLDLTFSICCESQFSFLIGSSEKKKISFCPDGELLTEGFYCGKNSCNVVGCKCHNGCRTVYPLVERDVIGFIQHRKVGIFNWQAELICVASILNSTHLRFSGLVRTNNIYQSFVTLPNKTNKEYKITWWKSDSDDNQITDEIDRLLSKSSKINNKSANLWENYINVLSSKSAIDYVDVKLAGVWQTFFDNYQTIKLNQKNLELFSTA